jgi:hypothetical protein
VAREPQQVAGCLCNAAFQIAQQRGARPEAWLARMQQVAPHCQSVAELLEVGKVAGWLAGMVQYRSAALAAAGSLRPSLAARVLGLPDSLSGSELTRFSAGCENTPGSRLKWHAAASTNRFSRPSLGLAPSLASAGSFTALRWSARSASGC